MPIKFVLVFCLVQGFTFGQNFQFDPELLTGNRSVFYQHLLRVHTTDRVSFQNVFLIDHSYHKPEDQIYFFRNTISYQATPVWSSNISFGLKNPGLFGTFSLSVKKISSRQTILYAFGVTVQRTLSLEQSLFLQREFITLKDCRLFYQVLIVLNLDNSGYTRGLQQFRVGVKKRGLQMGFGVNLDQFNNAQKTLHNHGLFLKLILNSNK